GGNTWSVISTNLGAGVTGIEILVVDPANPNTLYAASNPGKGVIKSVDGGANWTTINTGLPTQSDLYITSFTIDPKNSSTIYVMAGLGKGIFKNVDGGALWTPVNSGVPMQGSSAGVVVDPIKSLTLFLGIVAS